MKQFLYLDTDIVNSIIAQAENGLPGVQTREDDQASTKTNKLQSEVSGKGTFGGSLARLAKLEAELNSTINGDNSSAVTTTSREIVNITLHDAAFDIACEHIRVFLAEDEDMTHDHIGNYLEITRKFDFVDFDYLERVFLQDSVIDFMKKYKEQCIRGLMPQGNREESQSQETKEEERINRRIEASGKACDDLATVIKTTRSIFPYTRMLISYDGYLIPLSEKYFRVDPSDLGFKYGGEITCVGMVTNIIGKDSDPNDDKNVFATLQFTINEALRAILPTTENNLCVIHPIAIYYGK